jgi:hypothetical protein
VCVSASVSVTPSTEFGCLSVILFFVIDVLLLLKYKT